MSYLAKHKLTYYKKYKLDIWGFLHNTLQVLEDNTIYKVHEIFKKNKKLLIVFKETKWEHQKYKKKWKDFLLQNLIKFKGPKKKWIRNFEKLRDNPILKKLNMLKNRKYRYFIKNLLAFNLWEVFMKKTISKRLSTIFDILLDKVVEQKKVYFKRPFIYEPRVAIGLARKRRINEQKISLGLVKIFYLIYNLRQLKKIAIKAKLQSGVLEHNYLSIIESKLPSYIYRISLFPTLFESLDFVKNGNVWVNKEYKPFIYYHINLFDIIGFRIIYKSYIIWSFFKRLRRRAFLFMFPKCIYISFIFWFTILIKRIKYSDIINTFNFDYYKIINYLK